AVRGRRVGEREAAGSRVSRMPSRLPQAGRGAYGGLPAHAQGAGSLQPGHEVRRRARKVPGFRGWELGGRTGGGVRGDGAASLTTGPHAATVFASRPSSLRKLVAVPRIRLWLVTAALTISGCGGPFPQSTLHPRSDFARATDGLFTDIFWWAAAVFVVVELLLLVAIVRFRHREGRSAPT